MYCTFETSFICSYSSTGLLNLQNECTYVRTYACKYVGRYVHMCDQSEFVVLCMNFNLWIGPAFIFELWLNFNFVNSQFPVPTIGLHHSQVRILTSHCFYVAQ